MPDFLDRLGAQFYAADAPSVNSRHTPHGRLAARLGRRGLILAGTSLVVIAPASVAIVQTWQPELTRPGIDQPVKTDDSPVDSDATSNIAVLRRDQTAADRTATAPLLKALGAGNQVDGVQVGAIRSVAPGWALVPVKSVRTSPTATTPDQLCLTNGTMIACSKASSVATTGLTMISSSSDGTRLTGIVPDGVERVRFTPAERGTLAEAPVGSNFFQIRVPQTRAPNPVQMPDGRGVTRGHLPADGVVTWLHSDGTQIAPEQSIP